MLRLRIAEEGGLALPNSDPVTLIQVDSANLPYACHCPLCGGIFQLPESLLYKVEEDIFEDVDQDVQPTGAEDSSLAGGGLMSGVGSEAESSDTELESGGEENITAI